VILTHYEHMTKFILQVQIIDERTVLARIIPQIESTLIFSTVH